MIGIRRKTGCIGRRVLRKCQALRASIIQTSAGRKATAAATSDRVPEVMIMPSDRVTCPERLLPLLRPEPQTIANRMPPAARPSGAAMPGRGDPSMLHHRLTVYAAAPEREIRQASARAIVAIGGQAADDALVDLAL